MTFAGLGASAAGATFIASVVSADFNHGPRYALIQAIPVALGGFTGSLVDSVLGASVQEVRFCDRCDLESEQRVHCCGVRTRRIRGMPWCNNDSVNVIATAIGAVTAVIVDVVGRNPSRALVLRTRRGRCEEIADPDASFRLTTRANVSGSKTCS